MLTSIKISSTFVLENTNTLSPNSVPVNPESAPPECARRIQMQLWNYRDFSIVTTVASRHAACMKQVNGPRLLNVRGAPPAKSCMSHRRRSRRTGICPGRCRARACRGEKSCRNRNWTIRRTCSGPPHNPYACGTWHRNTPRNSMTRNRSTWHTPLRRATAKEPRKKPSNERFS